MRSLAATVFRPQPTVTLVVSMLASVALAGDQPERSVQNNLITSLRDPAVQVQVPPSAKYCGADRWILFDIADCELHVFVDADQQRNVQRLYWVQFEQYVPTKPDLHHTYDSPRHATLAGVDFYVDTEISTVQQKPTPGSDGEHVRALIAKAGSKYPHELMYVRFVHLLDSAKRKELMIIYGEQLGSSGFSAADLRKGGRAHDHWLDMEEELIERAKTAVRLAR